ncbi:CobW family GTP-binding protein [Rhizobium sp. RAF56]|uniref:CobW family GTP-binding protein n=1 Tax=Rhizobium sp. RAF56 TaxID=3233062 RepID=UPI003F99876C
MSNLRERIPVSILTGFLGAGKSTLLNRILKDPDMREAAAIINEFGDVGIDHLLVESSGDSIVELSDGCLCCTVRGELVDTLASLMDGIQTGRLRPIKRIAIETTGLADPAPVMQAIMGNPVIAANFDLDGIVTVVDAVNGIATLDSHEEARRQVAVADRLVLSKARMDGAAAEALEARLRALNPRAPILDADDEEAGRASVLVNGLYDPGSKIADVGRWLHDEADHGDEHHHAHGDHDHPGHEHHDHAGQDPHDVNRHDASIRSFSIIEERPIDPMALEMFIDLLRSAHGERLLRMKAIVALSDRPEQPVVLHGVQAIFHPPVRLPAWPDPQDRRTRMVIITKDLPEIFVRDLFDAFLGKPKVDRPDRAALEDNPLAVPGMKF